MAVDPFAAAPAATAFTQPVRYVGFWARVFASIVDSILLTILLVVMSLLIYGSVELADTDWCVYRIPPSSASDSMKW